MTVNAQARQETVKASSAERGESSDDCRTWIEMVWMLRDAVDRSKHELRRLGKLEATEAEYMLAHDSC